MENSTTNILYIVKFVITIPISTTPVSINLKDRRKIITWILLTRVESLTYLRDVKHFYKMICYYISSTVDTLI